MTEDIVTGGFVSLSDIPKSLLPEEELFLDEMGFDSYMDGYEEVKRYFEEKAEEEVFPEDEGYGGMRELIDDIYFMEDEKKMLEKIKRETREIVEEYENLEDDEWK